MSTGKGRILASVGKVESGRVPKKGPGEYWEMVEFGLVSENKKFRRVPKKVESE